MKSVWISVSFLVVLIAVWGFYDHYADNTLHGYIREVEEHIIVAVEQEDWKNAEYRFDLLSKDWDQYKKTASFFLDRRLINETDYTFARAEYFIKSKDISNTSGELAILKVQLTFLYANESFELENIL